MPPHGVGQTCALWAWAAGVFEGEGTVGTYASGCRARVRMTDRDAVEFFGIAVGLGRVLGPYAASQNRPNKPFWLWTVSTRAEVAELYRRLAPWLCDRRRAQFEAALSPRCEAAGQMRLPL